ncbi:ABC transporter ATP-binding protein [Pelagibacterales bacterium SAG-MED03]|nr:ABC transporter ATP-binding protein [Pelagibacterales bacterium SAG-MED03]
MAKVVFENVSLRIPIFNKRLFSLKKLTDFSSNLVGVKKGLENGNLYSEILSDINFEVKDNDSVGIMGHNGCGKTTLLKVISGVYHPEIGKVKIEGEISPFLNVHAITKPDATGYENIKIFWLYFEKKTELNQLTKKVEEFSELGEYLNFPIKTYSAGMLTRLFFAILMNMRSDIAAIDEGISTGDENFQKKANNELENYLSEKKIKFFASHDINFVEKYCNKLFVMRKGKLKVYNDIKEGTDYFRSQYYLEN